MAQPRHTHLIQVEFWNEDWRCGSCKRWSWDLCPNLGKVFILNFCLPFQDEDVERLWWSENSVAQYLWCPFQGRPINTWRFYNTQRRLLNAIKCKNSPKKIRVRHMLIFYFGSQNTGRFMDKRGYVPQQICGFQGRPILGLHLGPLALELWPERKCVTNQNQNSTLSSGQER